MNSDIGQRVGCSIIDGTAMANAQRSKVTIRVRGTIRSPRSDGRLRRSTVFDDVGTQMHVCMAMPVYAKLCMS